MTSFLQTPTIATTDPAYVHPGGYCPNAGATGVTKNGTRMTCKLRADGGDRLRWRSTNPKTKPKKKKRSRKSYVGAGINRREAGEWLAAGPAPTAPLPDHILEELNAAQIAALARAAGLPTDHTKPTRATDVDKLDLTGLVQNGQLTTRGADALARILEDQAAAADVVDRLRADDRPLPRSVDGTPATEMVEPDEPMPGFERYGACDTCPAKPGRACHNLKRSVHGQIAYCLDVHRGRHMLPDTDQPSPVEDTDTMDPAALAQATAAARADIAQMLGTTSSPADRDVLTAEAKRRQDSYRAAMAARDWSGDGVCTTDGCHAAAGQPCRDLRSPGSYNTTPHPGRAGRPPHVARDTQERNGWQEGDQLESSRGPVTYLGHDTSDASGLGGNAHWVRLPDGEEMMLSAANLERHNSAQQDRSAAPGSEQEQQAARERDLGAAIRDAAVNLHARNRNGFVSVADVRDALAGQCTPAEFDAAAKRLLDDDPHGFRLVPTANRKGLTRRELDSAVVIGGEEQHAIQIRGAEDADRPADRPLPDHIIYRYTPEQLDVAGRVFPAGSAVADQVNAERADRARLGLVSYERAAAGYDWRPCAACPDCGAPAAAPCLDLRSRDEETLYTTRPHPGRPTTAQQTPAAAQEDGEKPRTVEQARQDVADAAGMSPSARRSLFSSLAAGNAEASPEAAAVYREAAQTANRAANHDLAAGFTDLVAGREAPTASADGGADGQRHRFTVLREAAAEGPTVFDKIAADPTLPPPDQRVHLPRPDVAEATLRARDEGRAAGQRRFDEAIAKTGFTVHTNSRGAVVRDQDGTVVHTDRSEAGARNWVVGAAGQVKTRPAAADAIRDAFFASRRGGDYMTLEELRGALADRYTRPEVDAALTHLATTGGENVVLLPEENQKTLTAAQRAAATRLGGQEQHLIMMREPYDETAARHARTYPANATGAQLAQALRTPGLPSAEYDRLRDAVKRRAALDAPDHLARIAAADNPRRVYELLSDDDRLAVARLAGIGHLPAWNRFDAIGDAARARR